MLLGVTLSATVADGESAPTSATSRATVSPCVHRLQHCVQLRDQGRSQAIFGSTHKASPGACPTLSQREGTDNYPYHYSYSQKAILLFLWYSCPYTST